MPAVSAHDLPGVPDAGCGRSDLPGVHAGSAEGAVGGAEEGARSGSTGPVPVAVRDTRPLATYAIIGATVLVYLLQLIPGFPRSRRGSHSTATSSGRAVRCRSSRGAC